MSKVIALCTACHFTSYIFASAEIERIRKQLLAKLARSAWLVLLKMKINVAIYFVKHNLASRANKALFANFRKLSSRPSVQIACWDEHL